MADADGVPVEGFISEDDDGLKVVVGAALFCACGLARGCGDAGRRQVDATTLADNTSGARSVSRSGAEETTRKELIVRRARRLCAPPVL